MATDNLTPIARPPVITPADRLGMTLCLAIITHAVIVLGVTFTSEDDILPNFSSMDIILVQQKSDAPEEAKLLAQANLQGGGDSDEAVTPSAPLSSPFPGNEAVIASPPPVKKSAHPPKADPDTAAIVAMGNTADMAVSTDKIDKNEESTSEQPEQQLQVKEPTPSAAALIASSYQIAALSAEVERKLEAKAQRPRLKFISASTKEYKYAAYMESWRAKVERIGNLNYPEAARQQKLSGSLILDVGLKPDGSIHEINLRKSSGHKLLDDAAIRIVELASPYSAFSDGMKDETDILHITRTWQFLDSKGFR